jgi:hypothetical protein
MSNEATIINNPDSTPGAVSTGYQRQNTRFIAQANGVDHTIVEAYAVNQVKVKISGPVDVNGVLYEIDTEATLTITVTGRYIVYLAGSGNNLTPTLLNTTTSFGTFDDSKNARYYSSQRVLNWVINCTLGQTPTVRRWLYTKGSGGFVYDDMVIRDDLSVEDDASIGGNLSVSGTATLPTISGGNLTLSGNAVLPTISGNTNITGDLTMSSGKDVKISGAGRVEHGGTPVAGYLSNGTPFYIKEISITISDGSIAGSAAHGITNAATSNRIFDAIARRLNTQWYIIHSNYNNVAIAQYSWSDTNLTLSRYPDSVGTYAFTVAIWYT